MIYWLFFFHKNDIKTKKKCFGDKWFICIYGIDIGHEILKVSGYVRQDDIFLGELTELIFM